MAIYSVVLDACVLVPISLADTLLRTAEKQLFRPVWSPRILSEVRSAVLRVHPGIDEATDNPQLSIEEVLVALGRAGVPNFADEVLKRIR